MRHERSDIRRELRRDLAHQKAENWTHPPGTAVTVVLDNGEEWETHTRSSAWILPSGHAVILLEGKSGGYLLDRVRVRDVKQLSLFGGRRQP